MTCQTLVWVLIAHGIGDYLLQSAWMATQKTSRWWPAVLHGLTYGIPFVPLVPSLWAWLVIAGTHIVIDRWRLARYVVFAKDMLAPARHRAAWRQCPGWRDTDATGSPPGTPEWLAKILLYVVDNLIHILINIGAVAYL